jgi:hypothetical protein
VSEGRNVPAPLPVRVAPVLVKLRVRVLNLEMSRAVGKLDAELHRLLGAQLDYRNVVAARALKTQR